jgi:hypothetical protein
LFAEVLQPSYGDPKEPMRKIISDELVNRCKKVWGLDEEMELSGVWRDLGVPHLWVMMGLSSYSAKLNDKLNGILGNLALCRFHSKHVALRK